MRFFFLVTSDRYLCQVILCWKRKTKKQNFQNTGHLSQKWGSIVLPSERNEQRTGITERYLSLWCCMFFYLYFPMDKCLLHSSHISFLCCGALVLGKHRLSSLHWISYSNSRHQVNKIWSNLSKVVCVWVWPRWIRKWVHCWFNRSFRITVKVGDLGTVDVGNEGGGQVYA